MKRHNPHRRQFLRGAGGFALALPFLPSLMAKRAFAGSPPYAPNPRFIVLTSPHGGVSGPNMYPNPATLPAITPDLLYGASPIHYIRKYPLAGQISGANTVISKVLTAASSVLTPSLIAKMNVVRGADIMFDIQHHRGGYLGNYANEDFNTPTNANYISARPSIDQVLAWSTKFYPSLANIRQRSINIDSSISSNYANPQAKTGGIVQAPGSSSPLDLFNAVFGTQAINGSPQFIADRVLGHFNNIVNGAFGVASRISSEDKQVLQNHVARLNELQRKLATTVNCGGLTSPAAGNYLNNIVNTDLNSVMTTYRAFIDVTVEAIKCGACRIATFGIPFACSTYAGDWHQDIAHKTNVDPNAQALMVASKQWIFENLFLYLVNALDVPEANGKTYLDNSLAVMHHEHGPQTHDTTSLPCVTAGSAAGAMNTGLYVDYRNINVAPIQPGATDPNFNPFTFPGLPWNRWLVTVLQAMGLSPVDYETTPGSGYAESFNGSPRFQLSDRTTLEYPDHVVADVALPLPYLLKP